MQKKALLALLLALMMTLSGCALIQKDLEVDRATEIVRVGDTVFTKGEIQDEVDYQLAYMSYYYSLFGLSFDPTSAQNIADMQDDVIDMLVENAVLNAKAKELGFDQLTEEEQAEVAASADATWETNRQSVQTNYFADTELEGDELTAALDAKIEELGVTYEDVLESETNAYALQKLKASVTDPVTVTDEELQEHLEEHVASAQTSYESNLSSYGISVNNGSTVYYRPAGYRMVKQILIKFNEEDSDAIASYQSSLSAAGTTATAQQNLLFSLEVEDIDALVAQVGLEINPETGDITDMTASFAEDVDEDVAAAVQELAKAQAQQEFFTNKIEEATRAAFANIAEEADEVLAQLAEGADWDELAAEHNDDPGMQAGAATAETGYAVCEGFTSFDSAFTEAAMAIPEVGQWSDKTEGAYGYYIIQYTSDVEEGPVSLDEVRDTLTNEVLTEKQNEAYTAQVAAWVEEADVEINKKPLND
ncbi:MAG: peptidylprolyl isomerase [Christensenellaceae bacterium]|nr:peptidylprolyl isomerase [Christensenellaceae bacterium]